ncbi:MAG: GntR family transcriptional regulator [Luminiphilus sp.]|jgi:DNA-binding GntR family transcriptional regulator|nr:GntR family transcriptional regulator [Luminiphilus sp.]
MSTRDPTQADAVRLAIESDIFNGRLAPGAALEEGRLASRFGVSRTPVREAITQLVQAGIVSKSAHKRAVVAELEPGTLLELFEALSELEGAAAFLSTSRMAPGEKTELMAIHEAAAENLRHQGDPNEYAELGSAFHQTIVRGCHNKVLIDTAEWLALRVLPYRRFQVVAAGRLEINQSDHDDIISAIFAGDAKAARERIQRHTLEQGDALMRFIALNKTSHEDFHPTALTEEQRL